MQGKEAGEREVAKIQPAGDQLERRGANPRQQEGESCPHARAPITLLVPTQQVAGEQHGQQHDKHGQCGPENKLPRRAIEPLHHQLHEVQTGQGDHRMAGVEVDSPQQPTAVNHLLQPEAALPGALGARAVIHPHHHAGNGLHQEAKHHRGRQHVAPTRAAGNRPIERLRQGRRDPDAAVEPIQQCVHASGIFLGVPMRKFWKLTETSWPSIETSNVSRSRGLGQSAPIRLPEISKLARWQGQ